MSKTEFLQTAQDAARAAAEVLEAWADTFTVSEKGPADLVTEADLESQRTIREIIAARFPDHAFLGEEGDRDTTSHAEYRWIVDPLDGTSNYVHRFPYYCVSIALEQNGEMIVGVVFDPNRDEMFTASKENGARLNGRRIAPSTVDRLSEALVVASLPVNVSVDQPAVRQFLSVLGVAQHLQRTGSAALNLCYVACGRIEAYFSTSLKPWDAAAGVLLVEEAGGRASTIAGGPLDVFVPDLLTSNGTALHEELQRACMDAGCDD